MRIYQNLGILEAVVPVPLCLVPKPNTFCMVVPVPLVLVPVPNGFYMVVPVLIRTPSTCEETRDRIRSEEPL